jgi:hypothetical protein
VIGMARIMHFWSVELDMMWYNNLEGRGAIWELEREYQMERKVVFAVVLVVCVAIVTTLALAGEPGVTGGWLITTFPSQTVQGTHSSLALDQDGNPHISFLDETSYDVKYVRRDGDNWEEQTVDTLTLLAWSNTSLALNENGQPQIAYPYANPCRIGHAEWDGTQWNLVKLNTGGCLMYVTLALDGTGDPCISYYKADVTSRMWLACRDETGWHPPSLVDTVHYSTFQELAMYHSLVLQGDGTPHLSYYQQILSNPAQLWYATRSGGSWDQIVVDEGPGVGSYSSLALDSQNRPRISYYDHANGDLKYASWSGSQWDTVTVDSVGDVGSYTSLALDGSGNPHISYYDATNRDLKYAYLNGGLWNVETADSSGDVGEWTSLVLDTTAKAHISYYDHTNGDLKYATNSEADEHPIYLPLTMRHST